MANVITLSKIEKEYGTTFKNKVLFGIDLEINSGEFVSVIGQSGSGKSTMLNIVGTLDNATSGEVIINNINTKNMTNNELAKLRNQEIGFIFQFHHLITELSVLENVLLPSSIKSKKFTLKEKDYAMELLRLVEMEEYANKNAGQLSGGQQQRVAIARALINKPAIILADEPTGNLDSETSEKIYDLFRKINLELKTTLVIITHDQRVAEKTNRIIEVKDGKIISDVTK